MSKPKIYDCFSFFNEELLLQLRLDTLWDHVDYFIISEATYTHKGHPRDTIFDIKKFEKYKAKIRYCKLETKPIGPNDFWKMREAKGTGGGDFRPPFIWIEKNILGKKKIGPIIYFTDGYEQFPKLGDYGTDKYHKNVFWLIVSPRTPNNNIKIRAGR